MISVSIFINGNPIYTRSAVNISKNNKQPQKYKLDDGTILYHNQEDGAVCLAELMLETIKEV